MEYKLKHNFKLLSLCSDIPYSGFEFSIKLQKNAVLPSRYCFALPTNKVPQDSFLTIAEKLSVPTAVIDKIPENYSLSNQLGFAYEASPKRETIKLYFEFWEDIKIRASSPKYVAKSELLFRGYKWDIRDPQAFVTADYRCLPYQTHAEILGRVKSILSTKHEKSIQNITQLMLQQAMKRVPKGYFVFSEVAEEGTLRKSFDINIYKANMIVGNMAPGIVEVLKIYNIADQKTFDLFNQIAHMPLGHISGGVNRKGNDFITLYFNSPFPRASLPSWFAFA